MAFIVMASIVMAYIGMALCSYSHVTLHLKAAMAYIVMAHIVMASIVMASIGMALHSYLALGGGAVDHKGAACLGDADADAGSALELMCVDMRVDVCANIHAC